MTEKTVEPFAVGDHVQKRKGYKYPGIVRSAYLMPGGWRYDVEADHPDFATMLHIFSHEQLEHRGAGPATGSGEAQESDGGVEYKITVKGNCSAIHGSIEEWQQCRLCGAVPDTRQASAWLPIDREIAKSGEMLCKMISLAVQRHAGQFDKGGRPYILHPLTVMHRLRTDDEELQCIAVGHDLLEDTSTTIAELEVLGFSDRVIAGICCLTKSEQESQSGYRQKVKSSPDAMRVKIEDLRHNSDIGRLKGVTKKDISRMARYHEFFTELKALLHSYPTTG